ncbi:MAG: glucosamine-6-phosphate deaminase [Planctomycetota bacterium]
MEVVVKKTYEEVSKLGARIIAEVIQRKPRAVLGLATGSTPVGTYKELIRMNKAGELDFSQVVTFNLDEYVGIPPDHPESYRRFMNEQLFDHINIRKDNTYVPDGLARDIDASCELYEQRIAEHGGVDLQLLGIGHNGHIGFDEPGSSFGSRTRVKTLTQRTREANARFFDGDLAKVPKYAITMGIGTILDARQVLLIANGEGKARAIAATVEGPLTGFVPATVVQLHRRATIVIDREAASKLTEEYPADRRTLKL